VVADEPVVTTIQFAFSFSDFSIPCIASSWTL
jgi:hypothetical protein